MTRGHNWRFPVTSGLWRMRWASWTSSCKRNVKVNSVDAWTENHDSWLSTLVDLRFSHKEWGGAPKPANSKESYEYPNACAMLKEVGIKGLILSRVDSMFWWTAEVALKQLEPPNVKVTQVIKSGFYKQVKESMDLIIRFFSKSAQGHRVLNHIERNSEYMFSCWHFAILGAFIVFR